MAAADKVEFTALRVGVFSSQLPARAEFLILRHAYGTARL